MRCSSKALLPAGNLAFGSGNHGAAFKHYLGAIAAMPELARLLLPNLHRVKAHHAVERDAAEHCTVAVCGWEMSHNAAGRVYTLAKLYERFAPTEVIGCIFTRYGSEIWPPLRESDLPATHCLRVNDDREFLNQAIDLVLNHPYDIVHLSKPRITNIYIGILYKIIWGARVLVDVDDEELSFVDADTPLTLQEYLQEGRPAPAHHSLDGQIWTRIAVSLVDAFDGITVCNQTLQRKYGGAIVRHARDERVFKPSLAMRQQARREHGIAQNKKVVIFLGTPRRHKGLLELMSALSAIGRDDLVLAVIGTFEDECLQTELRRAGSVELLLKPNQPLKDLPRLLALADYCILLQDRESKIAAFQTPAKLTDALAMGIPVLLTGTPPLQEFVDAGVVKAVKNEDLNAEVEKFLFDSTEKQAEAGRAFFEKSLSYVVNAGVLQTITKSLSNTDIVDRIGERALRSLLQPSSHCDALMSLARGRAFVQN